MNLKKTHFRAHQYADLSVLMALAGLAAWYCLDAYRASTHIVNLILILPVAVLLLMLCLLEFIGQLIGKNKPLENLDPITSVIPVITLFSAYVLSLAWLGFDVGTFLFVALFLWLHGERRWQWAIGYGFVFAVLVALFFSSMLPYPMPMLLLPTEY